MTAKTGCKSAKLYKPLEIKLTEAYTSLKRYSLREASLFVLDLLESHTSFSTDLLTRTTTAAPISINTERLEILMGLSNFEEVQSILKNKQTPPEKFIFFLAKYNQLTSQSEIEDSFLTLSPNLHTQLTDLVIEIRSYISVTNNSSGRIVNINFAHFYYLLAVIYRVLKQRNQAHQFAKKSIYLFPYNISAIRLFSNLITETSELEDTLFSNMEPVFYSLMIAEVGLSLPKTENTKEMVQQALKTLINEFPTLEYTKILTFQLYLKRSKEEKALSYIQSANLSESGLFELSDTIARTLMHKEEEKKLQALVNRCLKYKKYDSKTMISIGYLYKLKGMEDRSVEYMEKGLKLNPFNYSALIELSTFYVEQDKNNEAFECYIKAIELNPTDPEPLCLVARLYEFLGNIEMAVGYYWKAIELSPFAVLYWESIAECLVKGRAYDDALKCLKRLEAFENSLFAVERMVDVYHNQHDLENEMVYRLKLKDMYKDYNCVDLEKKTKNIYQLACIYFNKREFINCDKIIENLVKDENKFKNKALELREKIKRYDFESSIFDESGFMKKTM